MAYRFEFDRNNDVFRASLRGQIDDHEMRKYDTDLRQVLAKLHLRAVIVDGSAITKFDVSSATIQYLAAFGAEASDQTIPILMVAPPDHIYGMARMFQILSDRKRPSVAVVRSEVEAYTKLGLTNLQFESLLED